MQWLWQMLPRHAMPSFFGFFWRARTMPALSIRNDRYDCGLLSETGKYVAEADWEKISRWIPPVGSEFPEVWQAHFKFIFGGGTCDSEIYGVEYQQDGAAPDEWYDLFEDPPRRLCEEIVDLLNANEIALYAAKVFESQEIASDWLNRPLALLGHKSPADVIRDGDLEAVRTILGRIEYGVYS
jgi:hypothetical protein